MATIDERSATSTAFRLPDLGEGLTEAELVRWLVARGFAPLAATATVLVGVIAVVCALGAWIIPQVGGQVDELSTGLTDGLAEVEQWLVEGPLQLDPQQVTEMRNAVVTQVYALAPEPMAAARHADALLVPGTDGRTWFLMPSIRFGFCGPHA